MWTTTELWFDQLPPEGAGSVREALARALMSQPLGEQIKAKGSLSIWRLPAKLLAQMGLPARDGVGLYFLKRNTSGPDLPRWRQLLRALRRQEWPHCEAFHVSRVARMLQRDGIEVMHVVAAGEQRLCGLWPLRAFVLAEGVPGEDALVRFRRANAPDQQRLMAAIGALMARLHALGHCFTLRLHDLICLPEPGIPGARPALPRLCLIDLDYKGRPARAAVATEALRLSVLSKSVHEMLRSGVRFERRAVAAWWRAYRRALPTHGRLAFLRRLARQVHHLLSMHHANAELASRFPDAVRLAELPADWAAPAEAVR